MVSFAWQVKCSRRSGSGVWQSFPTLYFNLLTGNGGSNALISIYQYRKYAYRGVSGLGYLEMISSYTYNGINAFGGLPINVTAPRIHCDNR